jgi:hypothetical protein
LKNEENEYPAPDLNKTMINVTKELSGAHKKQNKKPSKKKSRKKSEKYMEKILDMAHQNIQDSLKKFQDNKNKEHEMTEKQIKELAEDLNKHQSETK